MQQTLREMKYDLLYINNHSIKRKDYPVNMIMLNNTGVIMPADNGHQHIMPQCCFMSGTVYKKNGILNIR